MSPSRAPLVAGAAVAVAAAVTLTVVVWPEGSGPGAGNGASASSRTSASPSPTRSYPLSSAPRTIPAVREHTAARGPGWKPAKDSTVVAADPELADEAKLLAKELKIGYRGEKSARSGDVELALAASGKGDPESYTLKTADNRVTISGPGQAGVFYGTRTLKQSLNADDTVPEGVVRDTPDRPQRGLNLDIARKHYTADWIEDRLRQMADLKLNQLGLHFSDDQAFRIESDTHPEVVSEEHLTKAEVRRIVKLAQSLHITIVAEIDSPGHLGAVLKAHPDLQLRNTQGVARQGAVDISKAESAKIVDDLLTEYAELFPGNWFHVGADEYQALTVSDPAASYPQLAEAARKVRSRRHRPGPHGGLAERPRRRHHQGEEDPQGVERRLLRRRDGRRRQGHRGGVLDGQGDRCPAAPGLPRRGPQGDQPQRRVPLLRARRAQRLHLPDG